MATKGKTKKPTARREAADETTSSERLTALVEESDALARIVAKNPSAPVSLLRVLSRSEDEATRKNVILKRSIRNAGCWWPLRVLLRKA